MVSYKRRCWILRSALRMEGSLFALRSYERGGCPMVTYSDLIQIGILVVGIIGLIMDYKKK